ncbi:tRNA (guanine-N(1)-)-methyltransferase [Commensalibacter sp. Nvir]|uniref:tRNA (guanosine(37)-N1)-methyltransferase TrmD n=1 Tax=Commensalibacter sp. Nvir TaxID=3069817 RepID=UPI002D3BFF1C|nr:tRNA (guanine-N(1)-)-methyltransferase [Commensalibacter sp. Nvir]
MTWQVDILTLFPEMFPGFLEFSLSGKALNRGEWSFCTHALRNFGLGNHKAVDDTPFGGGAGMVIRPDVLSFALEATQPKDNRPMVYLSPKGKLLTQASIQHYASGPGVYLICGRYEGIDDRVLRHYPIEEVSIGDYILSGGEPAALIFMDACIRLLPGVMGSLQSGVEESFSKGLLEYPHYTKPAVWEGKHVPDILKSGNHQAIALWREKQAQLITQERRPDLWERVANVNK